MDQNATKPGAAATHHQPDNSTNPPSPWVRPLKQFGLFFMGTSFMVASIAVSRRSVIRRKIQSFPRFYSANLPVDSINGADGSMLAAQALGLATLNVTSFAVMLTGGLSWGFDLSSLEEVRRRSQSIMYRPDRQTSPEDEAEFEQMIGNLMAKLGMDTPAKPDAIAAAASSAKPDTA